MIDSCDRSHPQASPQSVGPRSRRPPGGIVLVGLGVSDGEGPGAGRLPPLEAVAARLAELLAQELRSLAPLQHPDQALAALDADTSRAQRRWWAALGCDAGLPLVGGWSWAAHLGAWRQPCLLVVSQAQLATGLPAAGTALLRGCGVPLVGVLQLGGYWEPHRRRRDGLCWVGMLPSTQPSLQPTAEGSDGLEGDAQLQGLLSGLRLRWRQLQGEGALRVD